MARRTSVVAEAGKPTIVVTREFDAPRGVVFDAFTKPEHVARWWGRHGTTLCVCEIDLRPGGAWRFVIRDPAGNEHPFRGVYREVVRPERIVNTFIYDVPEIRDHPALATVRFEETGGTTRMTEEILHQCVEDRDAHLASGMEEGLEECMQRLDELLAARSRS